MTEAKKGAARLLGCYRTGDANDPESYISAVVAVLARYSHETMRAVTDPADGLPSRLKWLPSIAEIREECDRLDNRERRKIERDKQIRDQLEARDRLELPDLRPRKSYEQLVEECRSIGLMIGKDGPKGATDIGAFRQKFGITQEQWNAIPDAVKHNPAEGR